MPEKIEKTMCTLAPVNVRGVVVLDEDGEESITGAYVQNNRFVRTMFGQRGIRPEDLPPVEDIGTWERRVTTQKKKRRRKLEDCRNRCVAFAVNTRV